MRHNAHASAVWFAAAGLLAGVGGCAGTPMLSGPVRGAPTPYATSGQHMQATSAPTSLAPQAAQRPPYTAQRPAWPAGSATGQVVRGQNAGYYGPTSSSQQNQSNEYLRGPMAASSADARNSAFVPTAPGGYAPAPPVAARPPYEAAQAVYAPRPTGAAASPYRRVQYEQYESVPSNGPVYGVPGSGPAAAAPGGQTVAPGPPAPGVTNAPGAAPWVEGGTPYVDPVWPESMVDGGPQNMADMIATVQETHTGQFMFGVGVNSDAGLTGQIVISEQNFDITRFPTSFDEFANGTAFRGGGQGFRIEALPGTQVQRYMVSLSEPYLLNTDISLNVSAFYFDRLYFDYDEQRYGGRIGLGYRLTPDLSFSTSIRAENVDIKNPRLPAVWASNPELRRALGSHDLFSARFSVARDKRDNFFAPTQGHFLELSYEQVFGSFDYPRGDIDFRQYFLVRERPDGSGRQTVSMNFRAGFSGSDTPIFENYFAGGYSTLRGFNFRGASPKTPEGIIIGGQFRFLGSVEYMMPVTADDMLRLVAFVDFGTVEQDIEIRQENFRVAPGFGMRIFVPAMGPAPIALDFAFPIAKADSDDTQVFSFFVGFGR